MEQSIKIYQINKDNYKFKSSSSDEGKISIIIKKLYGKYKKTEPFDIRTLSKYNLDTLTYYLFVHNFTEKESDWSSFLPYELVNNNEFNTLNLTLLLFISDGISIYVVVGGKGYEAIIPFIDHSFGLTIMAKILEPHEDIVTSINTRVLTGRRSGSSDQFRADFKLSDYIQFGKVPVEVHLTLSKSISNEFFNFMQKKEDERIKIYAGKSFKVKKDIDFQNLHKIIIAIGDILERPSNDYLTTYAEIKGTRKIEEELRPLLVEQIYNDRENVLKKELTKWNFKFDFCDPNKMVAFYEADYYTLKEKNKDKNSYNEFSRVEERESIYQTVISRAVSVIESMDLFQFKSYLQGVRICAYSNNKQVTSSNFLYCFTAEFEYNGQTYFLVDTKWYKLNPTFITDLKNECVSVLKNHKLPSNILNLPWDKNVIHTEGKYNLQYDSLQNYIVFDTFVPDNIELCDVMYIENDTIYLIHVKYGFNASLRDLNNQITLSAKRVYEDVMSNDFSYIDRVYHAALPKSSNLKTYTNSDFRNLFKRKLVYVFAFTSGHSSDELVEDNVEKYNSNIARFSLIQCVKEMMTSNYEIKICQIRNK